MAASFGRKIGEIEQTLNQETPIQHMGWMQSLDDGGKGRLMESIAWWNDHLMGSITWC